MVIASPPTVADVRSVRARITVIAALATTIAGALAGVVLITQLGSSLRSEVDTSLERQIVNFDLEVVDVDDLGTVAVPNDLETLLVVIDDQGVVVRANDPGVEGEELAAQLPPPGLWAAEVEFVDLNLTSPTQTTGTDSLRAAYQQMFPASGAGEVALYAVVARSNDPVDRTIARVRNIVLIGVPLLVAFVAALAWWLTGRSLRPVDRMRREVDEISSTDLERRVSEPAALDEIGRLALTMNAMLTRLETSQKSQEQFVSDAAHELRTPLASIASQLDVDTAHPQSADRAVTASNVRSEVSRLQSLIDGLLTSARGHHSDRPLVQKLLDLDVVATGAVDRVAKPATVMVDQHAIGIGTVRGDERALASAVDNLLANAYRHAQAAVAISVGTDHAGVWLTVDDDGSGIDPNDRDRVFDRFVRLDEARTKDAGGSGLGLALARDTAQRHGGTLHIETSPLGGARFALRLPEASPTRQT